MSLVDVQQHNVPDSYRDKILKWNGWGYSDSYFKLDKDNDVVFTGSRYEISGQKMPLFRPWFEKYLGIDMNYKTPSCLRGEISPPKPIDNLDFINFLRSYDISFSNAPQHRIVRSHGHTVHDIINLRNGIVNRIPDIVVWPRSEADVIKIIEGTHRFNVAVIPLGGGTSVSNALECPHEERRSICSLDMALMDRILSVDEKNLICRAEAGIVGQNLETQLNAKGFTCGHEPDSIEFSTLGGWVATRASGMKKNKYGNIEDLLIHVNLVTPKGKISKNCLVPRISCGPDLHQIVLGSEGIFGVITEATIKIFPLPEVKKYGSLVFPNFESGVNFFREVAKQRCQPASLRLVDNEQFVMGQALKAQQSLWTGLMSKFSKLYVTQWKRFNVTEMVAATCVYEGTKEEVESLERRLNEIARKFNGIPSGEENGKYGYRLTFAIAYLRDLGMDYGVLGESFETSVPWDNVLKLCISVKRLIHREAKARGIIRPILASCRVTQVYDSGACVYFYFGFNSRDVNEPLEVYDAIETSARNEILACGGSISHHHGVGKLRKSWMQKTVGNIGISVIRSIKAELDPKNIFANGNLIEIETKSKL